MIQLPDKDFESLRDSEERYRTLVKTSPEAVTVSDLQGNITEVSKQTLKLHGYTDEKELIGRSAFDLIAPEDHARAMENLQKTLTEGAVKNLEYTLLRKDGSKFVGELSASLIKVSSGAPKAFIATTRDITEKKKAEEALKERERLYRTLAESSPDFIFILDRDLEIHYVNSAAAGLSGSTPDKIIGKNLREFFPASICDRAKWDIQRTLDSGQTFDSETMIPFPGGQAWVQTLLVPLKDDNGKANLVLGITRDLTKHKQTEDQLRDKMRELKDSNENAVKKELRLIELEKEVIQLKQQIEKMGGRGEEIIITETG